MSWPEELSPSQLLLVIVGLLFGGSVLAAVLGAVLVRLGMRRPWVVRRASLLAVRLLEMLKRPLTIVVLDEVSAVIRTGHYTKNISDALLENHDELKSLVAEKVRADPNVRLVSRLPGYDTAVSEISETVLRVIVDMLSDPRTDELVSDLLRNNLEQIRLAVRQRDHEDRASMRPADPVSPSAPVAQVNRADRQTRAT